MLDDGLPTVTSRAQDELEERVLQLFRDYLDVGALSDDDPALILTRKQHAKYLRAGLGELPAGFIALDASRTWICYWVAHALALLGAPLPAGRERQALVDFLATCQHPGEGGFGGGPYQLPHLAPTYAAVAALVTLGGEEALRVVDRERLWGFLLSMCVPPEQGGGMMMHKGGEVDVRGCYCALAVCHMLNLDKQALSQACGMVNYVKACQSYEGGIGGEPWNEAHGGYTFCGLAALALLGRASELDLPRLLRWAARCQGIVEGGFMGRTNKLVDGCYSFWQGAAFPLLAELLDEQRAQHAQRAQQQQPTAAQDGELGAAVQAAAASLLSGEAEAFVSGLATLAPAPAAEAVLRAAQQELDRLVEESLQADDRYKAAVQAHAEDSRALEQEAAALLDRAGEVQAAVERAAANLEVARCSAAALLAAADGVGGSAVAGAVGAPASPGIYNAAALQLWVLKCCQAPRGGLRDKPGKPPDYYHSCYCLSGLASSQRHSGLALGGPDNLLARADPLCNVVQERLEEALAYYGALPQPS